MSVPSPLFEPTRVGAWELANRVVMAPMTRNRADADRVPSPLAARYYAQRASAGLIVTEATHAHPRGYGYPNTPASRRRRSAPPGDASPTRCTRAAGASSSSCGTPGASGTRRSSPTARSPWRPRPSPPRAARTAATVWCRS
jgi:2,4-dienoyl-CoA reductase-like NADH-dependent reductase (Old Yellow Enzyme family)